MKRYIDRLFQLGRNKTTHHAVFEQRLEHLVKVHKAHPVNRTKAPVLKSRTSPQVA